MLTGWSELALQCGGICSVSETMENLRTTGNPVAPPSVRIKHYTRKPDGASRFPKLDECAHFHYDNVELGPVMMCLCDERPDSSKVSQLPVTRADKENEGRLWWFCVEIASNGRSWVVRRNYENFRMLDKQLHRCVYDRKFSLLTELPAVEELPNDEEKRQEALRTILREYISRFSDLAGSLISCGPVLNWLELDNRGNRLIVTDEAAINTPAVAAAYVTKRYTAQAGDEISFEVGDMVSVIDMPPPEESTWWRGKRGYEVGFFPSECVEVIGEKVPQTLKIPGASTKPVLRKHGKLIAFFRSFLLSRPSRGKLKQSGILKERVFGCDLGEHLLNTSREIPLVLKCCTEFIEAHGIVDGIYRLSGVTSNIQKLRLGFDEDRAPDLSDEAILQDVHCVASLLKMYFRELPNPLLTYQLYDKFVGAVQSEEGLRLLKLRDIVQQLPPPHYRTLEFLMQHLAKVASYGSHTSMTPKNLAIVWAPNLLRSKDVESGGGVGALHVVGVQAVLTEYLIRYVDLIFNDKLPILQSPSSEQDTSKKLRPKSVAISTPTKLLSLEEARSRVLSSNLAVSQQKYIDVGGGPESLPDKYHTVIELSSSSKRSSGKLKKSPSGWKSFFSRGWNSGSTREKDRGYHDLILSPRKISTCSLQYASTNIPLKEKAVTEMELSHVHSKLLSEKRAESIISSLDRGDKCYRTSEILRSLSPTEGLKIMWSNEGFMKEENSSCKSSNAHKHIRSVSHDSYFENTVDIPAEDNVEEDDGSVFLQMDNKLNFTLGDSGTLKESRSEEQSFAIKSELDHMRDTEIASLQKISLSDNGKCEEEVKNLPKESYSESSKSSRKQRLRSSDSDVSSPKMQKLNFKHFRQAFSSPSFGKKLDFSFIFTEEDSLSNIGQEKEKDFLRGSIRKTKEWFVQALSPDTGNKKILPFPTEQEFRNSINIPQANNSIEVISKTYDKDLVNNNSVSICAAAENTFIKQSSNLTTYDGRAQLSFISDLGDDKEITGKTVIERYGNEETVIVEVHATQESSSDEDEKLEESYRVVDEMLQAASKKIEQEHLQEDNTKQYPDHTSSLIQSSSIETYLPDSACMPKVEPSEKVDENQVSRKFHYDTVGHVNTCRSISLHSSLSSKEGNLGNDDTTYLTAASAKHLELALTNDTEKYLSDTMKTDCIIPDSSSDILLLGVAVSEQNSSSLPLGYSKDVSEKNKKKTEELWFSSSSITPENEDQHVSDLDELFSYKLLDEYDTAMTPVNGKSTTKTLPNRADLYELQENERTENICEPLQFLPSSSIPKMIKQEDLKTKHVEEVRNTYTVSRTCRATDEYANLNILPEMIENSNLQKTGRLSCEGICNRNIEAIQHKMEEEELKASKQKNSMMMEQQLGNHQDVQNSSTVSSQKSEISLFQDKSSSDLTFRKRISYERPSPVEECKRKFESEIGRTIVRDRKMKLEMEQIKAEMQEKFQHKQEKSSYNFNKDSQLLTQTQKLDLSWDITKEHAKKTSDVVELRRSPGRQFEKTFEEKENERKRMSEPSGTSLRLTPNLLVGESKRVSEPTMTQVYLQLPHENKKASLKQLVSKFESPLLKEEHFSSEKKPYKTDLLDDCNFIKYNSPMTNIFTQIKNLTLQSEQPTHTVSAKCDHWSDSIQKHPASHDFTQNQIFSSKTEAQKAYSWGPETTLSKEIKEVRLSNIIKPRTLDLKKTSTCNSQKEGVQKREDILRNCNSMSIQNKNKTQCVQTQEISLSENKDVLGNPVDLPSTKREDVFGPIRWHSLSPLNSPTRELESHGRFRSESSPVDSKIINRRERINRLKEERRNQLREKWRSASFSKDSNNKACWRRNPFSSQSESETCSRIFNSLSSPVKEQECHTIATCPAVYAKDTGPKPVMKNKVGDEEGEIWVRERAQKWQKQFLEKATNASLSYDVSHYGPKHFTEDMPSTCKGKFSGPVLSHGVRPPIPEKQAARLTVKKAHIEGLTLKIKSIPATQTNQTECDEESKIVPKIFLSEETASAKTSSDNSRESKSLQHVPSPQKHIRDRVAVFEATS